MTPHASTPIHWHREPLYRQLLALLSRWQADRRRARREAVARSKPRVEPVQATTIRATKRQGWCWLALGAVVSALLFWVASLLHGASHATAIAFAIVAGLAGLHAWGQSRARVEEILEGVGRG